MSAMYPYWFMGTYAALLRMPEQPAPTLLCAVAHGSEQVRTWQRGQVYFAACAAPIAQGAAGVAGRPAGAAAAVEGPAMGADGGVGALSAMQAGGSK